MLENVTVILVIAASIFTKNSRGFVLVLSVYYLFCNFSSNVIEKLKI